MDIEQFRVNTPPAIKLPTHSTTSARRGRSQQPFLRGPVPLWWLARAAAARGSEVTVGLSLWFMRGVAPGKPDIKVTAAVRKRLGLSADQMRRGLLGLELAGLVEYASRGRGRCPVVRIVDGVSATDGRPTGGQVDNAPLN